MKLTTEDRDRLGKAVGKIMEAAVFVEDAALIYRMTWPGVENTMLPAAQVVTERLHEGLQGIGMTLSEGRANPDCLPQLVMEAMVSENCEGRGREYVDTVLDGGWRIGEGLDDN